MFQFVKNWLWFRPPHTSRRRWTTASTSSFAEIAYLVAEKLESRILLTPVFTADPYSFSVNEDAAVLAPVGQVSANDPAGVQYGFGEESFGEPFDINPSTGAITVQRALDYEWQALHTLTVTATNPAGDVGTTTVEVSVGDVAEDPVFSNAPYSFTAAENTASGTVVGSVGGATDPQGGTLTYGLSEDEPTGSPQFAIDGETGAIRVQGPPLDFEAQASYALTAIVIDPEGNFTTVPVAVTISDVTGDPTFGQSSYSFSIDENATAPAALGSVSASGTGIGYSLDDGFSPSMFTIDPATGAITLGTSLDYESTPSLSLTVYATDASGLSSAVSVTLSVNNLDEPPEPNQAPTVSGLAFTITDYEDGYAVGELAGTISDDHVTPGIFELAIDIDNDTIIDWIDQVASTATGIWAPLELPYTFSEGVDYPHEVAAWLTEYEDETGTAIVGPTTVASISVAPRTNAAPIFQNLAYTYDSENETGYVTGDIFDTSRHYGDYTIEVDFDGDGTADDWATVGLDWETFAYEFASDPGSQTVGVRVLEWDSNAGETLEGSWASVTFTVPTPTDYPPVMNSLNVTYDQGETYIEGAFTDNDFGGPYELELDTNDDQSPDRTIEIDFWTTFSETITLDPGEGVYWARVVDTASGLTTAWVASGYLNGAPAFGQGDYSFIRAKDELAVDLQIGSVSATDPNNDPLQYRLILPQSGVMVFSVNGNGILKKEPRPAALAIDANGNIKIADTEDIKYYFGKDFMYTFTVEVSDGAKNGNKTSVEVSLFDDWEAYRDDAERYLILWKDEARDLVTATHSNATTAENKLKIFATDHITSFTGGATSLSDLAFAGAALGAGSAASGGIAVAGVLADVLINAVGTHKEAGLESIINEVDRQLNEIRDQDYREISNTYEKEDKTFDRLVRDIGRSNDTLDLKAKMMFEYFTDLKDRLPRGQTVAPVNDIYGELLIELARAKGWQLYGSKLHKRNEGKYWYEPGLISGPGLDFRDVAVELNSIGYEKGDKFSLNY